MKLYLKKSIYKKKVISWFGIYVLLYMNYALCLNWTFTGDQVNSWNINQGKVLFPDYINYILGGRIALVITEGLRWLLSQIGVTVYMNQYVYKLFILGTIAYVIVEITELFQQFYYDKKKKILLVLFLLIAFVNPYYVEIFTYTGFEWAISLLLIWFSTRLYLNRKYIWTIFALFFAISIYQSYIEIFLIIITTYIFIDAKLHTHIIKEYCKMLIIAGIPAITNIFMVKLFVVISNMLASGTHNIEKVHEIKVVSTSASIIDRLYSVCIVYYESTCTCFGMLPKGTLLLVIIVLMTITIAYMLKKNKSKADILIYTFTSIAIQFFSVAIYFIAVGTGATAGRIVWIVFLAISALGIISLYIMQDSSRSNFVIYIIGTLFIINIYVTQTAEADFLIANKLDMQEAIQIQAEIQKYEKKSGMCIDTIAVRYADGHELRDCSPLLCRKYIMGTYHNTTFHKSWSNVELVNYINKEHYKKDEMPEAIYRKYFAGQKWTTFMPDEQMAFEGTTAYWLIY